MGKITNENIRILKSIDTYSDDALTGVFDKKEFAIYLARLIEDKGLKIKEILEFSNISKSYLADLRDSTQNKQPGREKILDLSLGINASQSETDHLLRLAGYHELDSRGVKYDRIMIWGLSHKKSPLEIRSTLCENGYPQFALRTEND